VPPERPRDLAFGALVLFRPTPIGDHLYMVINAGHEDKDIPHMKEHLADFVGKGGDASLEMLPQNGILALQGPKAACVLQSLVPKAQDRLCTLHPQSIAALFRIVPCANILCASPLPPPPQGGGPK